MKLDPVLIEILSNKVTSVTEEAGYTIRRIGHTLFVKEVADFCAAMANLEGQFFAYPREVGATGSVVLDSSTVIKMFPNLKPGDVVVTNHPYASDGLATHTPDIQLLVPYFYKEKLVCYGWSFLHISDVGGRVPGSVSPSSTEIFQEGLLIPPVRLCIGGEFNPDVLNILSANSRTPDANLGDLKAMIAAHRVAQRRVVEIIEQHGLDTFMQCQTDLIEYSRMKARDVLRLIPDGVYEFWDYLDDDLMTKIPLRVRIKMTARDGELFLDYSGTDPQTLAAYNIVTRGRRHPWLTQRMISFICTHDKDIPFNAGLMQNVHVEAPLGTVLNPEFPASTGVRHATAMRVNDVIQGALSKAVPELTPGCVSGVIIPVVFAEPGTTNGQRNVLVVELMIGGTGGRNGLDGVDGRGTLMSSMSNNPLETVESAAALVIRHFGLRANSGGAGKWRGGSGLSLTFEALKDDCSVLGRGMERFLFRAWGVAGGEPGAPARTIFNMGRPDERELGKIDVLKLNKGDTFTVMTPGGGGYGDPFERDAQTVLSDVLSGMVDPDAADRDYGVVIANGGIDEAATARRRASRPLRDGRTFGYDETKIAWENVFDDASVNRLNALLLAVPAHERTTARQKVYAGVLSDIATKGIDREELVRNADALRSRFIACIDRFEAERAGTAEKLEAAE